MSESHWYYSKDGESHGPVARSVIRSMVKEGTLTGESRVCRAGSSGWTELKRVRTLNVDKDKTEDDDKDPPPYEPGPPSAMEELGRHALDRAKQATGEAMAAAKELITDPMGGQGRAAAALGDAKCLQAGLVFVAAFAFLTYIASIFSFRAAYGDAAGFGFHIKAMMFTVVFPLLLWGGLVSLAKGFGTPATWQKCLLSAGVSCLPLCGFLLVGTLLGPQNFEPVFVVFLFAFCLHVLLLNSGLLHVLELSTRKAVLLTPTLIIAVGYLASLLFRRLF